LRDGTTPASGRPGLRSPRLRLQLAELSVIPPRLQQRLLIPSNIQLVLTPPPAVEPDVWDLFGDLNGYTEEGDPSFARLEWNWDEDWYHRPYRLPEVSLDGCLDDFVHLADASADEVYAFALKWGPLLLCEHGAPSSHQWDCSWLGLDRWPLASGRAWEPLGPWYMLAQNAREILEGAADVHYRRISGEDAWFMRHTVEEEASEWLKAAAVTPSLRWPEGDPAPYVTLTEGGLFGVLAIQLAAALTSPLGIYRCTTCGFPFTPAHRKRRMDQRRYCPSCSMDASLAAKRRWWRENRSPRNED
jgi:hypothetical protein